MTPTPVAPAGSLPTSPFEEWEMRVDGTVYLNILKANRFGQPMEDNLAIGPNRKGMRFQITEDDRRDNQRLCADPVHDPFTNGMLMRVDTDQQASVETTSPAVLSDEELLAIIDLPEDQFRNKVLTMAELPLRNLRAMADAAGASHTKVTWLDEHIHERFLPGGPQTSIEDGGVAQRMS